MNRIEIAYFAESVDFHNRKLSIIAGGLKLLSWRKVHCMPRSGYLEFALPDTVGVI